MMFPHLKNIQLHQQIVIYLFLFNSRRVQIKNDEGSTGVKVPQALITPIVGLKKLFFFKHGNAHTYTIYLLKKRKIIAKYIKTIIYLCHVSQNKTSLHKTNDTLANTATSVELYSKKKSREKFNFNNLSLILLTKETIIFGQVSFLLELISKRHQRLTSRISEITMDSTPDISHTDQQSVVIWFDFKCGDIHERFLMFVNIEYHYAKYIFNTIISIINNHGIIPKFCSVLIG